MEYYLAIGRSEILLFVAIGMTLEGIVLSVVRSDRARQIPYDFTYLRNLKKKKRQDKQTSS